MGTPHCIRRAGCVCFQQVGRGYASQQEVLPGEGEGQDVRMLSTASVLRLRGTCQD